MDQPREVAKPARGQLNRKIKCPCRCIRGKYIYMYCCLLLFMYGHTYSKSVDQPGEVASPARGQLNGKINISLSAFAPENLVSRDGFDSPVPRQPAHLHTQAESGAYLRDSSRVPHRRPFIHL